MAVGIDLSLKHTFMIIFTIASFSVLTIIYINIISAASSTYTGLVGENLAHAINIVYAAPSDRDSTMLLTQTKGRFVVNFPDSENGTFVTESIDDRDSTNKTTHTSYIFRDIIIDINKTGFETLESNIQVCPAGTQEYQTPLINKKGECASNREKPCFKIINKEVKCHAQEKVSENAFIFSGSVCIKKARADPTKITLYHPNKEKKC
ncbi:MAG: hypothetical protein COW47_00220 [Candidatus Huberarchaeum crystalense]|uniref:Uncharacterized protein n=1 Tax=Huberarchaeum crystalense TaxID=2014257 RepID=A0A2G9LJE1_HUBC1|nr:MAG: hypothetical protein COW69_01140 [Candidatus Huberarchaeum crystalense]PIV13836.1 MAG: hypothetical protein COS45_00760 [Candidatus Huberarchaeum crystalense]PIV46491.1 MAG: hypothetical protein COS22_01075 [Candidatus Huberarchaeum crystalense]PIV89901.1 MAG: hypothetical protein COW47_00220 [Candidatus Huberarchaeum crystalense]PIX28130.1 MAG: hypothetical protein COZ66_01145 [Candidatus Huberarchaeum crystalense]